MRFKKPLFRAWDIKNNKWFDPGCIEIDSRGAIYDSHARQYLEKGVAIDFAIGRQDRFKRKMFENDIVICAKDGDFDQALKGDQDGAKAIPSVIVWDDEHCWYGEKVRNEIWCLGQAEYYQVIGNMRINPQCLEQK